MIRTLYALVLPMIALTQGAQGQGIEGDWTGAAALKPDSGLAVTLRLKIDRQSDSLRVRFSLPESRFVDMELPSPFSDSSYASFANGHLHAEFAPDIGFGFIGRIVPHDEERIVFDGDLVRDELKGTLRITSFSSPVILHRTADPGAREPAVYFFSAVDSLRLGGKLVLPAGRGPFPAVVFVTGSDADPREVWQLEARALAAAGVASLLYDKRGVGESSGANHDLASWDDLAGDVAGAVAYLRSRGDIIDPRRIGLIGQSQGTWIITKVAAADTAIHFLVNISGSGISAAEQETYRTGALMKASGFSEQEIERARAFQRQKFQVAKTGNGWRALDSTMKRLRADSVRWFPGYGSGAAAQSLAVLRLYGVLQFNYDPTRDLRKIKVPVLVLMGANDLVFPPELVVQRMRTALASGGNHAFTARIIANAGHALTSVQTFRGKPFRRAVNTEFLNTLVSWVSGAARQ